MIVVQYHYTGINRFQRSGWQDVHVCAPHEDPLAELSWWANHLKLPCRVVERVTMENVLGTMTYLPEGALDVTAG